MILSWDVYQISCAAAELHGVKLRGRIRRFSLDQEISCLVENASDEENVVRFALPTGSDVRVVEDFIKTLVPHAQITEALKDVPNPVLSKLKVNDVSRYE